MITSKKSNRLIFISLIIVLLLIPICKKPTIRTAYADMGPKPSVIVDVENLNGRVCYGTLLSYYERLGPTGAYSPENPYIPSECDPESEYYNEEEHAIWKAFVDYEDSDGYYYQQVQWNLSDIGVISWRYYPPQKFKILLYFPETQTFVSSNVYERYAFHSYFSAKLTESELAVTQIESIEVKKSYDYTWEAISLITRILITVLIELGVALLFKLKTKRKILSVIIVNAVTQTVMNIALNILAFFQGAWSLLWYIPIELAVFVIEAVAYTVIFNCKQPKTVGTEENAINPEYLSVGKCVLLSLVANILSFAAGFALIRIIPGVFYG